jgi:hypothetical protein
LLIEPIALLLSLFLEFLKLPFRLFCLPLQFIHQFDEGSDTFCSPVSCSQRVIYSDVSALVELLMIPTFFKKRFFLLAWEGGLLW